MHSTDSTVPSRELDASSSHFSNEICGEAEDGGTVRRQQEFSNLGGSVTNSIQYVETVRNTESPMKLRLVGPPKKLPLQSSYMHIEKPNSNFSRSCFFGKEITKDK